MKSSVLWKITNGTLPSADHQPGNDAVAAREIVPHKFVAHPHQWSRLTNYRSGCICHDPGFMEKVWVAIIDESGRG